MDLKIKYLDLKKVIEEIENHPTKECLNRCEKLFLEILNILKLSLISERDSYYGYFLMNLSFEFAFEEEIVAGIKLDQYPPVFVSNPMLFGKYTLREMNFIFSHEIEHLILNHPYEIKRMNYLNDYETSYKLNLACDASVNDRLICEINKNGNSKFMKPIEGCITSDTFRELLGNKNISSNEHFIYYYNLIKDISISQLPVLSYDYSLNKIKEKNEKNNIYSDSNVINTFNTNDCNYDTKVIASDENTSINKLEHVCSINDIESIDDHNFAANDIDESFILENTRAFLENSKKNILIARGWVPDDLLEKIEKVFLPQAINWKKILKKYLGTIPLGKRPTKYRLNRRQPFRFDLSGHVSDMTINVVIAIDTSASMGKDELEPIFSEINYIFKSKKTKITVIECDASIQKVYEVKRVSDIDLNIKGRGGTSFTPVIEYLNDNKQFRDALLIYFTDGYGETVVPKPLLFRIIWILPNKHCQLSLKKPYGFIINLEK